ncbi:MAG: DUF3667 domain-containing protein [Eudoraea sp.]|nr:DUF3667 domain-containing protein [Eudoraea sp.]
MSDKPTVPTKGRYLFKYRGTQCLNCGHPLDISDKYCPNCAQANSTKKLSMKDFFEEFFSNLSNFDSKLFTTIKALVFRPGSITRDYIEGKRMSYTNPFRFLLSLAIVYFLMITYTGPYQDMDRWAAKNTDQILHMDSPFNFSLTSDLQDSLNRSEIPDSLSGSKKIAKESRYRDKRDSLISTNPATYIVSLKDSSFIDRFAYKQELFIALIQRDTMVTLEDVHQKFGIENNLENRAAFGMASSFLRAIKTPGSFISSLISNLPFATFFFLPVFAVFIWLVYIRKKYTYTDNLIFSFHNQSLLFILLIVSFLVDSIFNFDSALIFLLIFAIYLYKAMRNFYEQGRFKTILKYLFLNTIFFILAGVAAFILIIGGVFTY